MADLDYTVDLTIGSRSWTIQDGDVPDLSTGPVVLAGLRLRWAYPDTALRPAQPEPMTAAVSIAVADGAELSDLDIGNTVTIDVWVGPVPAPFQGHKHSQTARFIGRVAEVEAAPYTFADGVRGMVYTFRCVDHLADLAEVLAGYQAWPAEGLADRRSRLAGFLDSVPGLPQLQTTSGSSNASWVAARDANAAPVDELLEEYTKISSISFDAAYENTAGTETAYIYDYGRPIYAVLDRQPYVSNADPGGDPGGELAYVLGPAVPHIPGELPGRLVVVAGVAVLTWEPTAETAVPVIPASIVELPEQWTRTKGTALNTVEVETNDDVVVTVTTESVRRHRSAALIETELVDYAGPGFGDTAVEAAIQVAGQYMPQRPRTDREDTTGQWPRVKNPRVQSNWTVDELVIHADQAPELLNPITDWSMHYDQNANDGTFYPHGEAVYGWFPGIPMPSRAVGTVVATDWAWPDSYPVHPVVIHGIPASQHPEGRTVLYAVPESVELVLAPSHGRADLVVRLRQDVPDATTHPPISSDSLTARPDLVGLTYNDLDPSLTCDDLAFVRGT